MKILLMTLNTSLFTAGSNQMLSLARFLLRKGYLVSCVYQFSKEKYAATVRNFQEFPLRQFVYKSQGLNQSFLRFLTRRAFDIAYVHCGTAEFLIRHFNSMNGPAPQIFVGAVNSAPISPKLQSVYSDSRCQSVLAVSQFIANQISEIVDEKIAKKVLVVHSATNLVRFRPMSKDIQVICEFQLAGFRVVGLVAHARPYKRIDIFLRASKLVSENLPRTKFLIVGKIRAADIRVARSILRSPVKCKNGAYCLGDVVFTDLREDVPNILSTFDVSINCSDRYEGIPGAIRESLAMEIPVICTDIGGVDELIEDGITGFMIPHGDEKKLAQKVCWVLENYGVAKETAREGRLRIQKDFSTQQRHERIYQLFETVFKYKSFVENR